MLQPSDPAATSSWDDFVLGWELGIYQNPILGAAVVGAVLGFLSAYIVMRRMVFVSAAVTQAAALGVALAFWLPIVAGITFIGPTTGGVVLSLAAALLLSIDPRRTGVSREMMLGMVYALAGGAAILVGSRIRQEAHDIQSILFGPSVLIAEVDLDRVLVTGALVMAVHLWWWRGLVFASFDPVAARVQRLPVRLLELVLLLSIGVMVGVSARAVGALPVFALSTMPAIAALQLARGHLLVTFGLAALIGAGAGIAGYLVAFFGDFNVGASQTVVVVAVALIAVILRLTAAAVRRAVL
jgi:zinc transport system permease protein